MKIATHNGHFHADEIMAVAALLLKYPGADIIRTRRMEEIESADIVVDVGHIHDPSIMRFDHHQPQGAGKRSNGIPYASFGLVWKEFGVEIAGGEEEANLIEEKLVMPIDALDNGVNVSTPIFRGVKEYSLGEYFESFAYGKETLEDSEKAFFVALPLATDLLNREIEMSHKVIEGAKKLKRIYDESENKKIIILPELMSWKRALIPTEAVFVVYPRIDGFWGIQCVPKSFEDSFDRKHTFPKEWAGLENQALSLLTGVEDAVFCLSGRWLAGAKSKEGAIKLAEIALNA